MDTEIIITGYKHHEHTGHISINVKSRTVHGPSTWEGPEMTYGVDAISFMKRFNSDFQQLEAWIVGQHRQFIGANRNLLAGLEERKGKVIRVIEHGAAIAE